MKTHRSFFLRLTLVFFLAAFLAGWTLVPSQAAPSSHFAAAADTYTNAASAASSYGSETSILVGANPQDLGYLRFTIPGPYNIRTAVLRLYARSDSAKGFAVKKVGGNSWNENTLTYTNAPSMGDKLGDSGAVKNRRWVEVDVSAFVKTSGTYSFGLSTDDTNVIKLSSRESGDHTPELVVTYANPTAAPTSTSVNPVAPTQTTTIVPIGAGPVPIQPTATSQLSATPTSIASTATLEATATATSTATATATATATIPPAAPAPSSGTYYVSTSGSDSNPGTLDQPWRTVQKCLNTVKPGGACLVRGGTYSEALSLVTSGTSSAPITLKNYNGESVTISSGSAMTIKTTGYQSNYVIDGLRLLSSTAAGEGTRTIDFGAGINNARDGAGGNGNIILRNCYVEGTVLFYGPNNVVENCEFNGRNVVNDAVHVWFAGSTNNVVRNNTIHDYLGRAVWIDSTADNAMVRGNTVYNTYLGIDCDGAFIPVTHCNVIGNTIYNSGGGAGHTAWGCGIFLENAFNALVDGNRVYNSPSGNALYIVNYGNGPSWYTRNNIEYRTQSSGTVVRNNVFYNNKAATILVYSANGVSLLNNTISMGGYHAVEMYVATNTSFYPQGWTVLNNIITGSGTAWWASSSVSFSSSSFADNLYYNTTPGTGEAALSGNPLFVSSTDFHLQSGSPAIDKGYALGGLVPTDFAGTYRPQGAAFDLGAYEVVK